VQAYVNPPLRVERRRHNEVVIFDLDGNLDSRNTTIIKEQVAAAVDDGNMLILVNLSGVTYVDSAGLASLVGAIKTAREKNARVFLAGMSDSVRSVVEMTRLNRVLSIFDTVESATAALTSGSTR